MTSNQFTMFSGKLAIEVFGARHAAPANPVAVFIGGWGMSIDSYRERLENLSETYTVYAISLPGFGGSQALDLKHSTVHEHAKLINQALHLFDLDDKYLLMGHSTGGGVAAHIAAANPAQVKHLILMMPIGHPDPLRTSWTRIIEHMRRTTVRGLIDLRIDRNLLSNLKLAVNAKNTDLFHDLSALAAANVSVHLILAEDDLITPPGNLANIPGAHLHLVTGGHSWFAAKPEEFQNIMKTITEEPAEAHPVKAGWLHRLTHLSHRHKHPART
jgi:pimeloyl-ACP methyl ester carboxylesterase